MTILMKIESILLSEVNKTEKHEYCMVSIVSLIKSELIETDNRLVVARGRG